VREQLGALQAACGALRASADLMTVLRAVLLTGNHLNEGTARGAADGARPRPPPACTAPAGCRMRCCMGPPWVAGPGEMGCAPGCPDVLRARAPTALAAGRAPGAVPLPPGGAQGAPVVHGSAPHWSAASTADPCAPARRRAGFRIDTLLKLADVKGTDRRTSLLHFVLAQLAAGEGAAAAASLVGQLAAVRGAANLQARHAARVCAQPRLGLCGEPRARRQTAGLCMDQVHAKYAQRLTSTKTPAARARAAPALASSCALCSQPRHLGGDCGAHVCSSLPAFLMQQRGGAAAPHHAARARAQVSAVRAQIAELRAALGAVNGEVLIATGVRSGSAGAGSGGSGGALHEDFGAAMAGFYATAMDAFRKTEARAPTLPCPTL